MYTVGQNNMNFAFCFSCKLTTSPFPPVSIIMYQNQNTRIKEGIININPDEEPLRSELLSGKFTVLVSAEAITFHKVNCSSSFLIYNPGIRRKWCTCWSLKKSFVCLCQSAHKCLGLCLLINEGEAKCLVLTRFIHLPICKDGLKMCTS